MARKFLAALLAFVVSGMLALPTFAESVVENETIDNGDGTTTQQTTTTTTTTDPQTGKVDVTVVVDKTTEGNGKTVVSQNGYEKTEWEQDPAPDAEIPDVSVELIPGQTTTGKVEETVVEGDTPTDENDKEYDYNKTTTTEREVEATTSEMKTEVNDSKGGLVDSDETVISGLAPVYDEEDNAEYGTNGKIKDSTGKDGLFDRNYLSGQTMDMVVIDGVVFWLNDSTKTITNMYIPEGTELPEDFSYTTGQSVASWFNGTNIDKKKLPTGATYKNNVDISKLQNWYVDGELIVDIPEGADFMYVGTGEHSKYWVAFVQVVYEKDPVTGETVYDENGKPVIDQILSSSGDPVTVNGKEITELCEADFMELYGGSRATNFMLMDKDGNRVFGYCCDLGTGTAEGVWYGFSNLEDSDYYASEESAEHIRSIVLNGYWGTSDVPNEDGSYQTGSLEGIKANLKAAIENGDIPREHETYLYSECTCGCYANGKKQYDCTTGGKLQYDENGEPIKITYDMLELIENMTEGEALCATQAAVWSYSNGQQGALNGQDGKIVVDAASRSNFKSSSNEDEPFDNEANARVEFLYNWLINLDTEEESSTVINEKNAIEDITLVVSDKVADASENLDDNTDNDVYNTALNFKLAFVPGQKDDLLVCLMDENDQPILDQDGLPIVRRLAGENAEGQYIETITPDADGVYTLSGLTLGENSEFVFDLRLEGTQYLEQGVYVFAPEGGRHQSQSFVGIGEGTHNVDVSTSFTVSFSVNEKQRIVVEHFWSDYEVKINPPSGPFDPPVDPVDPPVDPVDPPVDPVDPPVDPIDPPAEPENPPEDPEDPPLVDIPEEDVPLVDIPEEDIPVDIPEVEIPEEDVPLAEVPQTGDNSVIWFALSAILAAAFAALFAGKKIKA